MGIKKAGLQSIENIQINKVIEQFIEFSRKKRLDNFKIEELEKLEKDEFIKIYLGFLDDMQKGFNIIKSYESFGNIDNKLSSMRKIIGGEMESIFNRLNYILSQKLENNQISEEEYIEMVKKINPDFLESVFDLKNNNNIYQLPLGIILNKTPKKVFNIALKLEKEEDVNQMQMELLSDILKNNAEFYIYAILADPILSHEDKIDKIASFNKDFIEDVYFFKFRGKVEKLFGEIFAYNSIGEDLVEKVILNKRQTINKYIRLSFIENIPDITKAIDIANEYGIGFRSGIALLTRIYKELEKSYDEELSKEYKKYKQILLERKGIKNLDIEETKLWEEFIENIDTKFNAITPKKELTSTLSDKNPKSLDLYTKIQNGARYVDIKEELPKIKIDKKLLKLIFQKYPIFIINLILKDNEVTLSKKDFEEAIFSVDSITKIIFLLKKMEQDRGFKFDKHKVLEKLVDKAQNFFDIINIRGNDYFKDFKLEFIKDGKINKKDVAVFIKMLLKSKERQLTIQELEEENIEKLNTSGYIMQWISPTHVKMLHKDNVKKPVLNIAI